MVFTGFPKKTLNFFEDLKANNNKEWFTEHKEDYVAYVQEPALGFVKDMGERLQALAPVHADTRTNGSGTLMRPYRDTRFSKDKTPYKTAVAGMFWEGMGKKTQSPAFGFHLDTSGLHLMTGMFGFSKHQLELYRKAVDQKSSGEKLQEIVDSLSAKKYSVVGENYKRIPQGYDAEHPRATLLKHNALYIHPKPIAKSKLSSAKLLDEVYAHFETTSPLHYWLTAIMN